MGRVGLLCPRNPGGSVWKGGAEGSVRRDPPGNLNLRQLSPLLRRSPIRQEAFRLRRKCIPKDIRINLLNGHAAILSMRFVKYGVV